MFLGISERIHIFSDQIFIYIFLHRMDISISEENSHKKTIRDEGFLEKLFELKEKYKDEPDSWM